LADPRLAFTACGSRGGSVGRTVPAVAQATGSSAGDAVEIAFKSLPGQIATGKVDQVVEYTGEGQLDMTGVVPIAKSIGSKGMLVVRIVLDDEKLAKSLPLGGAGTTAIYTKFAQQFHIITKITVRIKAWMNYVPI
jgi:multidrug resistance efflux pump